MMASADTQTRRLTMPPRLLPILLLMFGVQASVSLQSLRVASLPQLKTPGGPSCSSRSLPLAMTLLGSWSSIPGCRDGDSARDNRPLELSEAARFMRPLASALETSETPRSRSAGPSMSLGSGAGPSWEPPHLWEDLGGLLASWSNGAGQTVARREGRRDRLEGLLYDAIAEPAERVAVDEHTGRGALRQQGEGDSESALTKEQLETAEVVARLEGLLRVRSPTQTSKCVAKLAHITDINEHGGETAVLMRGLVVALIYGGLFLSLCLLPQA